MKLFLNSSNFIALAITFLLSTMSWAQELAQTRDDIVENGAQPEKLATGFKFTEGPAADAQGNVYFTDQPTNRILIWTTGGQLKEFRHTPTGRANGLYFDQQGNLIAAADLNNQLWSISPEGEVEVLVENFNKKLLNGPNDIWIDPSGGIYFTDPLYKRPYWDRDPEMQQDGEHVYYLSSNRKKLKRVAEDLLKPNGIIGTPDGKKLYIADIGDKKTYVYDIGSRGKLSNRKLFAEMGSDGMTMDEKGNVYLTGKGVTVFNPEGKKIAQIDIPVNWTANVTFGGEDHKTLFITASDNLYALDMKVKGGR
ncbi:MAG: SMP-30/gluconolactonase/LRE family protein [Candidatus Cyclobacteriaceae bacterium M3_2C_046]